MAYSTPLTAVTNATMTAAQWNASVRDNILESPAAKATTAGSYFATTSSNVIAERIIQHVSVSTQETTTSTAYTNLTTTGPVAVATTGPRAVVSLSCQLSNSTVGGESYMGVDLSGSTTLAADDNTAVFHTSATSGAYVQCSYVIMIGPTAGTTTFTAKYRVSAGTGTFQRRRITVLPF